MACTNLGAFKVPSVCALCLQICRADPCKVIVTNFFQRLFSRYPPDGVLSRDVAAHNKIRGMDAKVHLIVTHRVC